MIDKYNTYYRHWKDANILCAVYAMLGLFLTLLNWRGTFADRGPDGMNNSEHSWTTRMIVLITTIFGLFTIYLKFWLEAVWRNFKNPMAFYKKIVAKQVELGLLDPNELTSNFMIKENIRTYAFTQKQFWIEVLIMIIIPLPLSADSMFNNKIIMIDSPNYIDPANANSQLVAGSSGPPGSGIASTPYFVSDFILAYMFLRFHFLLSALIVFAPINEKLQGKRICKNYHFEPSFSF